MKNDGNIRKRMRKTRQITLLMIFMQGWRHRSRISLIFNIMLCSSSGEFLLLLLWRMLSLAPLEGVFFSSSGRCPLHLLWRVPSRSTLASSNHSNNKNSNEAKWIQNTSWQLRVERYNFVELNWASFCGFSEIQWKMQKHSHNNLFPSLRHQFSFNFLSLLHLETF